MPGPPTSSGPTNVSAASRRKQPVGAAPNGVTPPGGSVVDDAIGNSTDHSSTATGVRSSQPAAISTSRVAGHSVEPSKRALRVVAMMRGRGGGGSSPAYSASSQRDQTPNTSCHATG